MSKLDLIKIKNFVQQKSKNSSSLGEGICNTSSLTKDLYPEHTKNS